MLVDKFFFFALWVLVHYPLWYHAKKLQSSSVGSSVDNGCVALLPNVSLTRFGECAAARIRWSTIGQFYNTELLKVTKLKRCVSNLF